MFVAYSTADSVTSSAPPLFVFDFFFRFCSVENNVYKNNSLTSGKQCFFQQKGSVLFLLLPLPRRGVSLPRVRYLSKGPHNSWPPHPSSTLCAVHHPAHCVVLLVPPRLPWRSPSFFIPPFLTKVLPCYINLVLISSFSFLSANKTRPPLRLTDILYCHTPHSRLYQRSNYHIDS